MFPSTFPITPVGMTLPGTLEGSGPTGRPPLGHQVIVSAQLGAPLLVDGTTYRTGVFVAPCDGCYIQELWLGAPVKIAQGTNTFAVDNYDASGNAARNVLSTTNIDPDTVTALEGLKLTLTSTVADRIMDEGDFLNATLVAGTQSTAGQGYSLTAVIIVPTIGP